MTAFKVGDRVRAIHANVPIPLRWDLIGREGIIVEPAHFFGDWRVQLDGDPVYHVLLECELELVP